MSHLYITEQTITDSFIAEYGEKVDAMTPDELKIALYSHLEQMCGVSNVRPTTNEEILATVAKAEAGTLPSEGRKQ